MSRPPILEMRIDELVEPYRPLLLRMRMPILAVIALLMILQWQQPSLLVAVGVLMVTALAVTPTVLWLSGRTTGLPIVPLVAIYEVMVFAIPIAAHGEEIAYYDPSEQFFACLAESIFLGCMILTWLWFQRRDRPQRAYFAFGTRGLDSSWRAIACLVLLGSATLFYVAIPARWAWDYVFQYYPPGVFSAARTGATVAGLLSLLYLSIAHGRKELKGFILIFYAILSILYLAALATSLLLSALALQLVAWLGGYTLGKGKIPWVALLLLMLLLNILHFGKWEMRQNYWPQFGGRTAVLTPADYPTFYAEWFDAGWREFGSQGELGAEERENLLERVGLVQMYLLAQRKAPEEVPFLRGETYTLIPQLLVPRIFWPDKPRTHLGQILLNVHFGRQTLEDTAQTYIAWGLLAEGWSNFGWFGPPLVGLFMGWLLGAATAASRQYPMGSLRFLLAAFLLIFSISTTQQVMSVWLTSLFQPMLALLAVALVAMRLTNGRKP